MTQNIQNDLDHIDQFTQFIKESHRNMRIDAEKDLPQHLLDIARSVNLDDIFNAIGELVKKNVTIHPAIVAEALVYYGETLMNVVQACIPDPLGD